MAGWPVPSVPRSSVRLTERLVKLAADADQPAAVRTAAITALGQLRPAGLADRLSNILGAGPPPPVGRAAMTVLGNLDPPRAVESLFKQAETLTDGDAIDRWTSLLSSRGAATAVATQLARSTVNESFARAGLAAARRLPGDNQSLIDALLPLAGAAISPEALTPERLAELTAATIATGDPFAGERIYHLAELQCVSCHQIGGVGGVVGPDLTTIGTSAPVDYLIESIIAPNAKIKENYHSTVALTEDGVFAGIEIGSTEQRLILRGADNRLIEIDREIVLETKPGPSLMPAGLVDRLPIEQQRDLYAFLSRLGRPGDFEADAAAARHFDVLAGDNRVEQDGMAVVLDPAAPLDWKPTDTRIDGSVSGEGLRELTRLPINRSLVSVYLRTTLAASQTEGSVQLIGSDRAAAWLGGDAVEPSEAGENTTRWPIPPSMQPRTLVIRLDGRSIPEVLRVRGEGVGWMP